jgi:hypothetical protein
MLQARTIVFSLILLGLSLFGCRMYYQMEGPATLAGVEKDLDNWLGKSKQEQFQKMGDPEMCMMLSEQGEFCHWVDTNDSSNDSFIPKRIFYYDQNGIVCGWTYTGRWANQTNNVCKR